MDYSINHVDVYIDQLLDVASLLEAKIEDTQECQHINNYNRLATYV